MSQENKLSVSRFVSPLFSCNLYLLENEAGEVLIDPCVEYDLVYRNRKENLKAIIVTHSHFDHLYAINSYLEKTNCPIFIHKEGLGKLNDPQKNASFVIDQDLSFPIPKERITVISGDEVLNLLGTAFHILETPGHTSCSVSILVSDLLFTGDTLFKGTVGRTDLVSSSETDLRNSLNKLLALDGNYLVYPGHGAPTRLDAERRTNPYLRRLTNV